MPLAFTQEDFLVPRLIYRSDNYYCHVSHVETLVILPKFLSQKLFFRYKRVNFRMGSSTAKIQSTLYHTYVCLSVVNCFHEGSLCIIN